MKKPVWINILSNPFFLAAVFVLPGVIYFEISTPKFIAETLNKNTLSEDQYYFFQDIDGDGPLELIRSKLNNNGDAAIVIEKNNKIFQQINLEGVFTSEYMPVFIDRPAQQDTSKIFILTRINEKIWLFQTNPLDTLNPIKKQVLVDSVWTIDDKIDFSTSFWGTCDMNNDGYEEVLFYINAGFSIYPRRVYYYDIKNDTLIKSPAFGSKIGVNQVNDIDGNSFPEVISNSAAVDNMNGKYDIPYPDEHSWNIVLDHKLNYKFMPIEAGAKNSFTELMYIETQSKRLLVSMQYFRSGDKSPKKRKIILRQLDQNGAVSQSNVIELVSNTIQYILDKQNRLQIFEQDRIWTIDTLLRKMEYKRCKEIAKLIPRISHNNNTGDYFLFYSLETYEYFFVHNSFNYIIPLKIVRSKNPIFLVSQLENHKGNEQFVIQSGRDLTWLVIIKNPQYIYRFGYYIAGYLILLGFILLVQWLQRRQLEKKRSVEKEMDNLKFASLKNQLEPHFTMNVLNSIAGFVLKNSPEAAYEYTVRFSRMIHSTLAQSDLLHRSLHDEIEFVKDYLELQKLRFRENLHYEINISEDVSSNIKIPKMLIQAHVENAIKHGLKSRDGKGTIKISIAIDIEGLVITIADDGIGRKAASRLGTEGTGKGLETMQKYYRIFKSLTGKLVSHEVEDLVNEKGEPAGTKVIVKIAQD